jgi:DNA excision repair protein ERCC-1
VIFRFAPFHSARASTIHAMDDDFGDDAHFSNVIAALENPRPPPLPAAAPARPKIQQPTPQALPSRSTPSTILVSSRQKGNPILNSIRALPWEYSDIPADYVLGATTCALFLSLKYHRLHPEYIYSRIRALAGKYHLRVLLTMVDIQNHEESLKELSKTSLINNLTLVLCWSAQEAGRYLELYKSYEHASPSSIRAHQATSYAEKLVEFITVPRSINKTDAVGLVSTFGSIRAAVNARPEEIGGIAGWGEKKVQRWCETVREPFRVQKAARRGVERRERTLAKEQSSASLMAEATTADDGERGLFTNANGLTEETTRQDDQVVQSAPNISTATTTTSKTGQENIRLAKRPANDSEADADLWLPDEDEEEALLLADENLTALPLPPRSAQIGKPMGSTKASLQSEGLNEGMMAALAKWQE